MVALHETNNTLQSTASCQMAGTGGTRNKDENTDYRLQRISAGTYVQPVQHDLGKHKLKAYASVTAETHLPKTPL